MPAKVLLAARAMVTAGLANHDDLTSAMMERAELPVQMAELDEVGKRMPAPAFSGFRGGPLANITPASGL